MNGHWRVFISQALDEFFRFHYSELSQAQLDAFEPLYEAMIVDFYDLESTGGNGLIGAIKLTRAADYNHSGAGGEAIPFDDPTGVNEGFQVDIVAWSSGNPTRITNNTGDAWVCSVACSASFGTGGSTGLRIMNIQRNGLTTIAQFREESNNQARRYAIPQFVILEPNDYLELIIVADTAVTVLASDYAPTLSLAVLGIV